MSATNRELIHRFYVALDHRDAEAMAACYLPDARFEDPAFSLTGESIGDMWRMLCERGKDLRVEASRIEADALTGSAHWVARYTFSKTGRKVENRIDAAFRFRDGLIAEHVDRFSFWRWSRQALGPVGLLLGWTPWLRGTVRAEAAKGLAQWQAKRRERG